MNKPTKLALTFIMYCNKSGVGFHTCFVKFGFHHNSRKLRGNSAYLQTDVFQSFCIERHCVCHYLRVLQLVSSP